MSTATPVTITSAARRPTMWRSDIVFLPSEHSELGCYSRENAYPITPKASVDARRHTPAPTNSLVSAAFIARTIPAMPTIVEPQATTRLAMNVKKSSVWPICLPFSPLGSEASSEPDVLPSRLSGPPPRSIPPSDHPCNRQPYKQRGYERRARNGAPRSQARDRNNHPRDRAARACRRI